jgi:hypothetical protein
LDRIDVEHTRQHHRLVGDHADGGAFRRMKPQIMFLAWFAWISKKSPSSATRSITSRMS